MGNFFSDSKWNYELNRVELIGGLIDADVSKIKGINIKKFYYYPQDSVNSLDCNFSFSDFDLSFVSPFLPKDVVSGLVGKIDGDIKLGGTFSNPEFKGELNLKESSFQLDMMNTTYSTNGKIVVNPDMIEVNGIPIEDKYGSKGFVVGSFYHQNFTRYNYDLYASFNQPFMVMNTTYKMNPLYYGDAFITGDVMMEYDTVNSLRLNVDAKTEKGTNLTLPLYGSDDVVLQDFISFEGSGSEKKKKIMKCL